MTTQLYVLQIYPQWDHGGLGYFPWLINPEFRLNSGFQRRRSMISTHIIGTKAQLALTTWMTAATRVPGRILWFVSDSLSACMHGVHGASMIPKWESGCCASSVWGSSSKRFWESNWSTYFFFISIESSSFEGTILNRVGQLSVYITCDDRVCDKVRSCRTFSIGRVDWLAEIAYYIVKLVSVDWLINWLVGWLVGQWNELEISNCGRLFVMALTADGRIKLWVV